MSNAHKKLIIKVGRLPDGKWMRKDTVVLYQLLHYDCAAAPQLDQLTLDAALLLFSEANGGEVSEDTLEDPIFHIHGGQAVRASELKCAYVDRESDLVLLKDNEEWLGYLLSEALRVKDAVVPKLVLLAPAEIPSNRSAVTAQNQRLISLTTAAPNGAATPLNGYEHVASIPHASERTFHPHRPSPPVPSLDPSLGPTAYTTRSGEGKQPESRGVQEDVTVRQQPQQDGDLESVAGDVPSSARSETGSFTSHLRKGFSLSSLKGQMRRNGPALNSSEHSFTPFSTGHDRSSSKTSLSSYGAPSMYPDEHNFPYELPFSPDRSTFRSSGTRPRDSDTSSFGPGIGGSSFTASKEKTALLGSNTNKSDADSLHKLAAKIPYDRLEIRTWHYQWPPPLNSNEKTVKPNQHLDAAFVPSKRLAQENKVLLLRAKWAVGASRTDSPLELGSAKDLVQLPIRCLTASDRAYIMHTSDRFFSETASVRSSATTSSAPPKTAPLFEFSNTFGGLGMGRI
ncbi:hypothetical protein OC846_006250 [Tilletia horrida]|uniref:Uncharacterized protein n=1 Tax=Tilletia horrida TaxID=155126 RepID=A0AAN6GP06_9BASI|nr:hypothetical protein OC846_006250 [Tilletia horrida]KAK0548234.1 hypothetical protein OC845_003696 [Tilletia horrida]KAK0560215.1 hypothetical protein OC861_006359 [Tilletia horrida]